MSSDLSCHVSHVMSHHSSSCDYWHPIPNPIVGLSHLVMSTPHEITTLKHGIIKYANAMMETALGRDLYDQMELKIE